MRRLRTLLAATALVAALGACGSDQDPGVPQDTGPTGPTTTSHLLSSCPDGGPDATTPRAGCIGPGGTILYP